MTFSETHDHNGHSVVCHFVGGEPSFAIFEKLNGAKEATVENATEDEAIAYCKKYDMKLLFIAH